MLADDDVKPYLDGLDETNAADLRFIDIDVDCPSLGDMVIVDTPGLNALDGFHESVAREFLNESDAIVWVFSATRAGAGSEAEFLRELDQEDRKILGVLNKVDTLDAEERRELSEFLNERLGSALVDIVDVSAKRALDHAVSETGRYHDDPMFNVRQALDRQFRERSPQLKLELSVRRSRLALQSTIDALRHEADLLEEQASKADRERADAVNLPQLLKELGDELRAKLLDLSDHLTREALALGLVESGSGIKASALEDAGVSDLSYLEESFTEAALDRVAAVRRSIAERGQAAEVLADVFDRHFATWTRGFAAALGASKVANTLLFQYGQRSRDGERSFRDALREALEPVAEHWREELIALAPLVEAQVLRLQRAESHAPKAESLRLRQIWIPKLQALSRGMINIAENLEA